MQAATEQLASARSPGRELWLRWTAAVTLGEFAGFAVPAAVGAAGWALGLPALAFAGTMVAAGAVEGSVLGFAQWLAMRRYVRGVQRHEWVRATALGAAVAWTLGMTPGSFWDQLDRLPAAVLVVGAVLLGTALLLSLGTAQWLVLRRYVAGAGWWVPTNALAWALGMTWVFAGMAPVGEDDPAALIAAVAAVSGLMMGATVAAATGAALVWLLRRQGPPGEASIAPAA